MSFLSLLKNTNVKTSVKINIKFTYDFNVFDISVNLFGTRGSLSSGGELLWADIANLLRIGKNKLFQAAGKADE